VAALALSIGLAANANAAILLVGLKRRGHYTPAPGWGAFALKVVAASALMGGLMFVMARQLDWLALGRTEGLRAGAMALALAGSAAVYFGVLRLLGLRLRSFMRKA
jgi:putative peptidoglycan lipid II flippase